MILCLSPEDDFPLRLFSVASALETCQLLESLQPLWPQQPAQQEREPGLAQSGSCRGTAGSRAHPLESSCLISKFCNL
ncbi:leucine rich repeat containing 28 (predicted), isoform CRA_e [Rattus norvegicus]|uniref:Leucine rich repeat containing 28 (Predicted), isoform CRA_e n=1 Tax=Rattus norvegicus TaxID=10116 RepID=A6JBS4_RAT|nr:leucine rich repeat containing 28 (predicted), isoform CRA_e [Rattus norvegicus]